MRSLLPLAVLLITQISAAWAIGDSNMARPGAAYSTLEAADAAACERACADDTICMAWSHRENLCELKATVPTAVAQTGATSGVSARAPGSLRLLPPSPAPLRAAAEDESEVPAVNEAAGEEDLSFALLGGPEPDQGLRHRLGN